MRSSAGRDRPEDGETPAAIVVWDHGDGDVWAWEKDVSGRGVGCDVVALRVRGEEFEATRQGRSFSATVPLGAGENRVEALADRAGGRQCVGIVRYDVPLPAAPTARIDVALEDGRIVLSGARSSPSEPSGSPLAAMYWSAAAGNPAPLTIAGVKATAGDETDAARVWMPVPAVDGAYYVTLRLVDEDGKQDRSTVCVKVEAGRARAPDDDAECPRWVDDAIVYGVVPRKFGLPAFKATTARLDYLREMGFNTLWLSPSNATAPHSPGYAVMDYFTIRDDFGTEEDFRELVDEAHARGMRVLMDFVPNHTSDAHRYYVDAEEKGPGSVYWDLYDRGPDGRSTYYFSWSHLPNLNFDNPDVRRFMTEAMAYWVREYDIDGYRVDVAWGIRQRRPGFWPELRRELKRIKPDVFLLAEASARDPYYIGNGFDAAYDWTDELGHWAWQNVWGSPDGLVERLHSALTADGQGYPANARIFRFLNNNDTGTPFAVRHGAGMARVAAAMLFTLPGVPCPYTGEEFGADYHPYADIEPLDWDEDPHELRPYYRTLSGLRQEWQSLRAGDFERVDVSAQDEIYAYVRPCQDAAPVLVVLNFQDKPVECQVRLPARFADKGAVIDRLHGGRFPADGGTLHVGMPPFTARILTP